MRQSTLGSRCEKTGDMSFEFDVFHEFPRCDSLNLPRSTRPRRPGARVSCGQGSEGAAGPPRSVSANRHYRLVCFSRVIATATLWLAPSAITPSIPRGFFAAPGVENHGVKVFLPARRRDNMIDPAEANEITERHRLLPLWMPSKSLSRLS
jgi:hypothetical protein